MDPGLIEFRWPEHLQGEVNLYPNVITVHLAAVATLLTNVLSLQELARELGLRDGWVNFGGRDEVVRHVTEHLLGRGQPNILHIAGLSGIGKTRTVFEACRLTPDLNGVLYVERLELITRELYRYLEEEGRHVYLVIDETPLDQVDVVKGRLGEFADRIRVVTIGPAVRQAAVTSGQILVLPEPDTEAGVLEVVRAAAGARLSDDVLRSIAAQSGHDLRLALLLVRASQELPEFRGVPVVNIEGVWQRLMGLFAGEIGNPHEFRKLYEVLTTSIDVGVADDAGGEIVALAGYFQHPVEHVRDAAETSFRCGLGLRTRRFFEAAPRALAARLFAERVWPRVQGNLQDFFLGLPERLGRRFLERCHDCTGPVREEVMARLGDFFLRALSGGDVTVLASREASRLFQTWAELDPDRGLGWLRRSVEQASARQLQALDGAPDASGGWRGRRQLVWLCQNLASFGEHLDACEAILFRLALHETEPSIGNNSTVLWQSLFWPALASTEVPFSRRLPILLRRLSTVLAAELPLVLLGAVGCIEQRFAGLPAPPRVVGGRVVPPPWRPATWGELANLRRDAGRQILDVIAELPEDRMPLALGAIAEHFGVFASLGLVENVRGLFRPDRLDESLRRRLVAQLELQINVLRRHSGEGRPLPNLGPLEDWLAELSPLADLATRVRDLTAQNYWPAMFPEERTARYERLADELIAAPETFRGLADWFTGSEARSAGVLGSHIGLRDQCGRLAHVVRDWLLAGRCPEVSVGYLSGTASRQGSLPAEWAGVLDTLAVTQPEYAANATVSADVSSRGFERLLALLERLPTAASRFLRPLAFGEWQRVLSHDQQTRAARSLVQLADAGDHEAAEVGLDLIHMWGPANPQAIDKSLAAPALDLASRPLSGSRRRDMYAWQEVLRSLCRFYPRQVAELITQRITNYSGAGLGGDDQDIEVLAQAAAIDPAAVMEVIGSAVLDRNRRAVFGVAVFRGLFEAIGVQHVAAWVERHGLENLRWLARHFPSPYVDEAGRPALPPLTEWLFRTQECDEEAFSWFLMGRHAGTFHSESDIDPVRTRQQMQPFLQHELRRVREWAESEIREAERSAEFFREMREEDDRR